MAGEDPVQARDVLRLRDDVDSLLAQQRDDALAQQRLVLGDDYSHGSSACTVVPSPGLLRTTRMPSSASTRLRKPAETAAVRVRAARAVVVDLDDQAAALLEQRDRARRRRCAYLAALVSDSATTK